MLAKPSVTGISIGLVVVMLIAGLLIGLASSGTDLLNPYTSRARANEMDQSAEYQAQRDAIDLEYHQQERTAQIAAQQEQLKFLRQQHEQKLAYQRGRDARAIALMPIREGIFLGMLLSVCGGLTFYLVSLGRKARRPQRDPWQSPEWWQSIRRLAQDNEQLQRCLELSQQSHVETASPGGNGHHREPVWSGTGAAPHAGASL